MASGRSWTVRLPPRGCAPALLRTAQWICCRRQRSGDGTGSPCVVPGVPVLASPQPQSRHRSCGLIKSPARESSVRMLAASGPIYCRLLQTVEGQLLGAGSSPPPPAKVSVVPFKYPSSPKPPARSGPTTRRGHGLSQRDRPIAWPALVRSCFLRRSPPGILVSFPSPAEMSWSKRPRGFCFKVASRPSCPPLPPSSDIRQGCGSPWTIIHASALFCLSYIYAASLPVGGSPLLVLLVLLYHTFPEIPSASVVVPFSSFLCSSRLSSSPRLVLPIFGISASRFSTL